MLESSCRVCLTAAEHGLTDLFSLEGEETLADRLKLCCGVEPQENDQLPQKICRNCREKLATAWELRKRCIDTDVLLRNVGTKIENSQDVHASESDPADVLLCKLEEAEHSVVEEHLEEFLEEPSTPEKLPKPKTRRKKSTKQPPTQESVSSTSGRGSQKPTVHDLTCVFCNEAFSTRFKKNSHLRAHHSAELFCKVCNKPKPSVISTAKCLKRHKLGLAWSILCQVSERTQRLCKMYFKILFRSVVESSITRRTWLVISRLCTQLRGSKCSRVIFAV